VNFAALGFYEIAFAAVFCGGGTILLLLPLALRYLRRKDEGGGS
jgi:hypothetical protein